MYKVLIVEDDPVIAGTVAAELNKWGMDARAAPDFSAVLAEFTAFAPQLVLLDIALPFFNGYYWCQEIRRVSKAPIVFLSSAGDNMNIVMAMDMGADDFIAKPFDLPVLVAKVRALLRRTYDFTDAGSLMEHRGAVLNLTDMTVTFSGQTAALTRNEFRILQLLMEQRGRVVARDAIMLRLWEGDCFVDENTLTVNINRLRKKLAGLGLADFIATKKGVGYQIGG